MGRAGDAGKSVRGVEKADDCSGNPQGDRSKKKDCA